MYKWITPIEPVVYSTDAIDRDLKRIVGMVYYDYHVYHDIFEVLYNTGCRAGEALEPSRWQIGSNGVVVLQPQKGNDKRIMTQEEVGEGYVDIIKGLKEFPTFINYDRLRYQFKQFSMYNAIYVGQKKASLHLFRHNFVKKQLASGYDEEDIQQMLGERNLSSVKAYTESIYTNRPLNDY